MPEVGSVNYVIIILGEGIAMVQTVLMQERRRQLRERAGCQFVESDRFCELLLGFKRLVRADETALKVRGLLDLETGDRFFIEQEKLLPPQPHRA